MSMSNPVNIKSHNPFTAAYSLEYVANAMHASIGDDSRLNMPGAIALLHEWADFPEAPEVGVVARFDCSPVVLIEYDVDCDGTGYSFKLYPGTSHFADAARFDDGNAHVSSLAEVRRDWNSKLQFRDHGEYHYASTWTYTYLDEYETTADLNEAHWIEGIEADMEVARF